MADGKTKPDGEVGHEEKTTHIDADPKAHPTGNAEKDPHTWTTGGEEMTGAQASYLQTLSEEAGEEFDPKLTKGEASVRIDELKNKTGRGV